MSDVSESAYILYAFLGFQSLLLLALLGMVFRMNQTIGRMQGDINGLREAIVALTARVERLEGQVADLREQVAENRGLLRSLHERVDLVMRHRHDGQTGGVILTPAEPVPDPAAD